MHEVSLVRSLIEQVRMIVADNGSGQIMSVKVEIGAICGVEPELVRIAFDRIKFETSLHDTELVIDKSPMVVACAECSNETTLNHFVFRCGICQSGNVRVIRGDEFRLVDITLNRDCHAY